MEQLRVNSIYEQIEIQYTQQRALNRMNKQTKKLRETTARWMKLANVPDDNAKKFLKENLDALSSANDQDEDEELDMGAGSQIPPQVGKGTSNASLEAGGEQTLEITPDILNAMKKVADFVKQIEGSVDLSGGAPVSDADGMGDDGIEDEMGGMEDADLENDEMGDESEEGVEDWSNDEDPDMQDVETDETEDEDEEDKEQLDEMGLLSPGHAGSFLSKGGNKHKGKNPPQDHKMSKLSESEKRAKIAKYLAERIVNELAKEKLKAKSGKKNGNKNIKK